MSTLLTDLGRDMLLRWESTPHCTRLEEQYAGEFQALVDRLALPGQDEALRAEAIRKAGHLPYLLVLRAMQRADAQKAFNEAMQ